MHLGKHSLVAAAGIKRRNIHSCEKNLPLYNICILEILHVHISRNTILSIDLIAISEICFTYVYLSNCTSNFLECGKSFFSSLCIFLQKVYSKYELLLLWENIFNGHKFYKFQTIFKTRLTKLLHLCTMN